jgi:peptidoglycan hydrolase CwlO-like protein
MRKPVLFGIIAVAVLIAAAGSWSYAKYRSTAADYVALQADEMETRERYGAAIDEIAMIQDSLNAIVLSEEEARLVNELDSESRLTETQSDHAMRRISVIKAGIERTKDRIQELDANLKARGVKIAGLQKMLNNLKKSVTEKEERVAALTVQVDTLQTRVTHLAAHVDEQDQTIEEKRRELGTIYYVIGSKKELTQSGAVVATGGVLGVGKTLEPTGQVDPTMLSALDTDFSSVIRIASPKVEVLTAQPPTSYRLEVIGGTTELRILDPIAFRAVKHLIVMTG